jgi:hypothetical protein
MSNPLRKRAVVDIRDEYCDAIGQAQVVDDMDQLFGYCDCIGWDGEN